MCPIILETTLRLTTQQNNTSMIEHFTVNIASIIMIRIKLYLIIITISYLWHYITEVLQMLRLI